MAGWSAAYDAVFAKYGFIVSNDLDEVVTIAAVLTSNPLPSGDRVAVITTSGGAGIWGADAVSQQGLQVPELSEGIQAEIMQLLPSYGTARNPIDVTAQGVHSGGLQRSVSLLAASDEVDAILIVLSLSSDIRVPFKEAALTPVIAAQAKPIVFYSYSLPSDFARRELSASGVVVLTGLTHVGVAMRHLLQTARFELAPPADKALLPPRDLTAHLTRPAFSEADSKALLRDAGIALPDEVLVADKGGLDDAIARIGFPLVLKIQSPDIAHKSEVGGVRVNIATKGEAFLAWQALHDNAGRHRPDARSRAFSSARWRRGGVEIDRRHAAGCDLRTDGDGRPWRHHHGIVPRCGLSSGAGRRGRGERDAGRVEGGGPAQGISRRGQGRCRGAVALDRAGLASSRHGCAMRSRRSSSIRCWCIPRGRASPSSMRWWWGEVASSPVVPAKAGTHNHNVSDGKEAVFPGALSAGRGVWVRIGARRERRCAAGVTCPGRRKSPPPEIGDAALARWP